MTVPRLAGLLALLVACLSGSGCTSSEEVAGPAVTPTGTSPSANGATSGAPPSPTLAGGAEAESLSALPEGTATGTAVLQYSGVGEVREPFSGECSRDGETTVVEGAADSARIRLEATPDGVTLVLDDLGFAATSALSTGRFDVAGSALSLAADLVSGEQAIGTVRLDLTCGA